MLDEDLISLIAKNLLERGDLNSVFKLYAVSKAWSHGAFLAVKDFYKLETRQTIAFSEAILGHNVFITGGAGVGKSFTTKTITQVAAVARRVFRLTTPRITVDTEAIKRQLWTRSISLAAATTEFVLSFNMALDDHSTAARAAAAHRRDRHQVVPDRPVRFAVECGDGDE